MDYEIRIAVKSDEDLLNARQQGRELATALGFTATDVTCIVTAISELTRNILTYAGTGQVVLISTNEASRHGMTIVAQDEGPGIPDIKTAMMDGYSTSGGLGLGLPGVKRLMDEFYITSRVGRGTTVTAKKWREARATK